MMGAFEYNKELEMDNVLSFRAKLSQLEIQEELKKVEVFINEQGKHRIGPTVTTTFSIEEKNGTQIIDTEVLIPLSGELILQKYISSKKSFILKMQ